MTPPPNVVDPPEPPPSAVATAREQREMGVWLIIGFKALFGILYVAVAIGVFSFINQDLEELASRLVDLFNLDPDNRYIDAVLTMVPSITPQLLKQIAVGTFLYGSLELVQAVGLYYRKVWAEWLIIVATILLIPVEVVEIVKHATPIKFGVLVINILIVLYLFIRHRKQLFRAEVIEAR